MLPTRSLALTVLFDQNYANIGMQKLVLTVLLDPTDKYVIMLACSVGCRKPRTHGFAPSASDSRARFIIINLNLTKLSFSIKLKISVLQLSKISAGTTTSASDIWGINFGTLSAFAASASRAARASE